MEIEVLLRRLAPQVLGTLTRRYQQFDACEDAVQDALLAAAERWPQSGVPDNPRGWLTTVAARRFVDHIRSEQARRRREAAAAALEPPDEFLDPELDGEQPGSRDDTLSLLFLCCHPVLTPASQVALTLRAVGGLTTAQIAQAFLVPEATMAPRISRAKQRIKAAGASFRMPSEREWPERLAAVLQVLYLMFNEGYAATSGPELQRHELTREAIRLTRAVHHLLPDDGEVAGLLALMVLTDARSAARTDEHGTLIPLAEQDRALWDTRLIEEGSQLITTAMSTSQLGPYQLQAAIAAVHVQAPTADDTNWYEISVLYQILSRIAPNPMVTLNHAIAVAMTRGPTAGLDVLDTLRTDHRMTRHHRYHAVRAHLLEQAGDRLAARDAYRTAARLATSIPEQRYLRSRVARIPTDAVEKIGENS
ncbi:RNA polymerase sigma factor [Phytoactinopolyspora limicola]|uniref:RNA polymerase sigma factor n=1 Tax=Phytoactinopolyspora limicola TaxID=2715536 RepID=UPI001A9C7BF6|nr:RNA polymerase sigma factor [Phytoactinopolyspora limicola]